MGFLKKLLPALGVTQLFNPNEEADDVIATMVQGELASQQNLIFTTDRDFLQLVTPTTRVLVPSVGGRKEIMFTEEVVKEDLGVMPAVIKHLRSFYGDTSDNIPGVPRVPKKVLRSLVQAHGTVDGVFKSGLSGLTRGQYERLRSAEPQIRINLTLMQLETVSITPTAANPDPDAVVDRLKAVGINPLPIVGSFFGDGQSEIGV
jgi:DNA polymerase-1